MQTTKFLSLVRELIGKNLVTEDDSPSDFSMGGDTGSTDAGSTSSTSSTSTSSTSSTTSTSSTSSTDSDMSTADLGLGGNSGGAGLTPTYDVDVDVDSENPEAQPQQPEAPKYRVLDVMFDEDDDLNTKVKIQNIDTGKTEIKRLDEIII